MAASDFSITITPEGNLVSCPEQFGKEQIKGTIKSGVTRRDMVEAWKTVAVFDKCHDCASFPHCVIMQHCRNAEKCLGREAKVHWQQNVMLQRYDDFARQD